MYVHILQIMIYFKIKCFVLHTIRIIRTVEHCIMKQLQSVLYTSDGNYSLMSTQYDRFEKLFFSILFYSQGFAKRLPIERKSLKEIFFNIQRMGQGLIQGTSSNQPPHYLLCYIV